MEKPIPQAHFASELLEVLEELFDVHHGFFLDEGASFFATLDEVSAETASAPIAGGTASIATHVEHAILYIEVLAKHMTGRPVGDVDWEEIWERVGEVSAEEWGVLRRRFRETYTWLVRIVEGLEDWRDHDAVGASMVILAHTACHLGAVRQALARFRAA